MACDLGTHDNRKETCQHDTFSVIFKLDWLRHGLFRPIKMVSLNAKLTELYNTIRRETGSNWSVLLGPVYNFVHKYCAHKHVSLSGKLKWSHRLEFCVKLFILRWIIPLSTDWAVRIFYAKYFYHHPNISWRITAGRMPSLKYMDACQFLK